MFPRVHLDADIELYGAHVLQLLEPITRDQVLATAPRRDVPRTGCSRWVRWYYDVWESLPQVESGLFGRGVVVLSEEAQARVTALPRLMSDDLGMSDSFTGEERRVVPGAVAVVHPPRTVARPGPPPDPRSRPATPRPAELGVRRSASRTSVAHPAWAWPSSDPALALRLPVFVAVHVAAQLGARRALRSGDFTTWQRDESSRS